MKQEYVLWGTPHSLYTGKARSYLIKKGVPFREALPSDPRFAAEIMPRVGLFVVPVLETPQGELVQDTTAIIAHLENLHGQPSVMPPGQGPGPVQQVVAMLLDAYGSNALLPLAMHYRWTYRERQETFLRAEFGRAAYAGPDRDAARDLAARNMDYFSGFLPGLGVTPEVIPAMEAGYRELLDALDIHFQSHPYLLGGRPSLADFGMMAPLFAHLGRDPVPAFLMKTTAPNVFRWTERMNQPAIGDSEFGGGKPVFPDHDAIPATLEPVLRLVFADWLPGLHADAQSFAQWFGTLDDPEPGTLVSLSGKRQVHPNTGPVEYAWRGVTMRRGSAPHGLWHFGLARDHADGLAADPAARLGALLERTGGTEIMKIRPPRGMTRKDNVLAIT